MEQIVESVALAAFFLVETLDDIRPVSSRDLCGPVGAVVGDYIYVEELLRVILRRYAVEKISYDLLLVSRRDEYGKPVGLSLREGFRLAKQRNHYVDRLIKAKAGHKCSKYSGYYRKDLHRISPKSDSWSII